ncbi:MAG: hypothetical protein J2P48_00430 [Alphaproteobacteria bacterium]|nr:hypothetical protein [Alphaproteobacteria bacterium]
MKEGIVLTVLLLLIGGAALAAGGAAVPAPTIYARPTPAPLTPPVNPGPAVRPPAGLSPLLTRPGPVYPTPQGSMPAYPPAQLPGPVGQQNIQSFRNSLLNQLRQLERSGVSPGSERVREIQRQLNQTAPQ